MKRTITLSQGSQKTQKKSYPRPMYRKTGPKGRVSKAMYSAIENVLAKRAETKMVTTNNYELGLTTLSFGTLYKAPTPVQGAGDNQRNGNKVSPVGISLKTMYHAGVGITELWVRQIFIQIFEGSEITDAEVIASLFEGNTGQDVGPDGTLRDSLRKVNRQRFRVLKDDQLLIAAEGHENRVKYTKNYFKLKGVMTFHDNVATQPVRDRYAVVTIPMEADGDESLGTTVEFSYVMDFYYKDY